MNDDVHKSEVSNKEIKRLESVVSDRMILKLLSWVM